MNRLLADIPILNLPGTSGTPVQLSYPGSSYTSNYKFFSLGNIVSQAILFIFVFAGFGLLLMIIAAGFSLLTSAGDAKKLESGKQRLTYAIVGFLIIFTAYWGVLIAGHIFGFTVFGDIFK